MAVTIDNNFSTTSENPVQNKVIYNMIQSGQQYFPTVTQVITYQDTDDIVDGETTLNAGEIILIYE